MATNVKQVVEVERISCEVCKNEVPLTESTNAETADYIVHFCGLECFEEWQSQNKKTDARAKETGS